MIPELGHFALILALSLTLVQATLPLAGAARGNVAWMSVARPAAWGQFLFVAIAYAALTYAFVTNDFTVAYTALNSNSQLPLVYRFSAVWGAHEGSLLLWLLILSGWTVAVTLFSRSLPLVFSARVIAVMGSISIGFLAFLLLTSNPFDRLMPAPVDGRDLNPLLQDPGLVIHPPMLYLGYVGFTVAFAFAIAALLGGQLDNVWARWSRPWTTVAWVFLTMGITLGSWWAYYELGWGGWWFWDPVENASFMPWLVGTALIHSLAVTEKRGASKSWTVLLAIFAFALSLLGTFLVRSGVITSVHAFASDPSRGIFILGFLGVVVGGSLALYAWRAPKTMVSAQFQLLSRETMLLANSVLFVVAAATVLLGTIYPLFLDALALGKISVGPPYFNSVFVPLMIPVVFLIGVGPLTRWKKQELVAVLKLLRETALLSLLLGVLIAIMLQGPVRLMVVLGMVLALWVVFAVLRDLVYRVWNRSGSGPRLRRLPRGYYGMVVAHTGVAVFVVGITLTSNYSTEKDVSMSPGDTLELGGYEFTFEAVRQGQGPNYEAMTGTIAVAKNGETMVLEPEKRIYQVQRMPMTEAAIDAGLTRDIYVALGEPLGDGAWAIRLYHKPFVRWIWLGGIFMAVGGLLAASDRRYRSALRQRRSAELTVPGAASVGGQA